MTTSERAASLEGVVERRIFGISPTDFETRASDEGETLEFKGYASLFDVGYEMYGGPEKGGWTEHVDKKAFDRTLSAKPDVVLNLNHGEGGTGLPIARTTSGTLELRTDKKGLLGLSELDMRDPDVYALSIKAARGDVTQMSFAFRTMRQEWNDDYTERWLTEVSLDRGDISIVTNGASPTTSFQVRSFDEAIEFLASYPIEAALVEARALDSESMDHLMAARELLDKLTSRNEPEPEVETEVEEVREPSGFLTLAQARRLELMDR